MTTELIEYDYEMLNRELDRTKSEVFLGTNASFLGPLMCSLNFEWSQEADTAWTNGVTIWWNPKDFLGCTKAGRVSTLLHELGHVYRMHNVRQGDRCPDVWGIATDIAINRDLLQLGYKLEWLYPGIGPHPEIPFEVEEDIYEFLKPKGGGGQPNPQGQSRPGGASSSPVPGQCCGGLLPATAQQQQQIINNVVQAAHSATQAGDPGSIPGNVKEIIKEFLTPKVPWEAEIYHWMTELGEEDYTWSKPSRRYTNMYLPSRFEDEGRLQSINVYEDVSGSISTADALRFNSELKFLWDTFKPEKITIVQFDTMIQKIDVLEDEQEFTEIEIIGRGGTCLKPVRQHIMDTQPTAVIIFSDLQVPAMKPGPECPVLWVAISNKDAKVNFGRIIHIRP